MRAEIIQGTGEDGADLAIETFTRSFMNNLRARQEAVWGVLSHGRVVVDVTSQDSEYAPSEDVPSHCSIYLPARYRQWWDTHQSECSDAIVRAMCGAWGMSRDWAWDRHSIHVLLDVPQDLVHFVAENTDRPKPRRYNSTAVTYFERDGVAWLTPPEAKLYDAIKQAGWLFTPQPQFLAGEEIDRRPDFLLYWQEKAAWAVLIEIDSDAFHKPSQRSDDEAKERLFQSRGFEYVRFSAKEVQSSTREVLNRIADFCTRKFER